MACIVAIECFGNVTLNLMDFETKEEVKKWLQDCGSKDEEVVGFRLLQDEDSFNRLTAIGAICALTAIDDVKEGLESMLNFAFQLGKDFHQKINDRKSEAHLCGDFDVSLTT